MKLNEQKFFELAKANNFESADLYLKRNYSLSTSIFHGEVDSMSEHDTHVVTARGIINGKFGSVTTEAIDKNTPEFLIESIKRTANVIENDDPSIIFKGSEKYHKKSVFNKNVLGGNIQEKVGILLEIERKLKNFDKRINEVVTVGYEESLDEEKLSNSYGLKLSSKVADYSYYAEVTAKEGDEVRTGYKVFASIDPNEFDLDKFVEDCANDVLGKLGSIQCKTKKYPVVFTPECASTLLRFLLDSVDAEEVQKHTSLFEGKLKQQIVSKKLTVTEDPLKRNLFFRYFDDEGVATNKKAIIKNGVLETYLYTLQTAQIAGVEPTGNGYRSGSKASADSAFLMVKPGRKSKNELFADIKEGILINDLQGLHSGMNSHSGNFSLPCAGFMIRNGKISEPVSLITVADNLVNMFSNIKGLSKETELVIRTTTDCPYIYIKKMVISGK